MTYLEVNMAERPKTAAEIAEGKNELLDTGRINNLSERVANLNARIRDINSRLGWIIMYVKSAYNRTTVGDLDIDENLLQEINTKLDKINSEALKIGDTLVADYDEN